MEQFKQVMLCVAKFFLLVAYAAGIIGGLVHTVSSVTWPLSVCILVLGAFGFPTAKKFFLDIKAYRAVDIPEEEEQGANETATEETAEKTEAEETKES